MTVCVYGVPPHIQSELKRENRGVMDLSGLSPPFLLRSHSRSLLHLLPRRIFQGAAQDDTRKVNVSNRGGGHTYCKILILKRQMDRMHINGSTNLLTVSVSPFSVSCAFESVRLQPDGTDKE